MFEHRSKPVIARAAFLRRMLVATALAASLVAVSLAAGMIGYHLLLGMHWIDAFLNAAMILSGMGPIETNFQPHGHWAKLFAGCYALYSGFVVVVAASILLAPLLHRLMHKLQLEDRGRA